MTTATPPTILYLTWHQAGRQRHAPVDRPLRIGRHPSMDIVLNEQQVSRQHCTVTPRADGLAVDATASTNGIGGPRGQVPAMVAPPGSWFMVGSTRFDVGLGNAHELAGHSLPPSRTRSSQPAQRRPTPVLFAALGGVAVIAVVVVAIVMVGTRRGGAGGTPAAPATITFTDATSTLKTLGGDPTDASAVARAQDIINQMPAGTQAVRTGDSQTDEQGDLRVVTTPYELRVPGQAPKPFTMETDYGRDGPNWVQIATYIEDAP